jgi:hypothetical protein
MAKRNIREIWPLKRIKERLDATLSLADTAREMGVTKEGLRKFIHDRHPDLYADWRKLRRRKKTSRARIALAHRKHAKEDLAILAENPDHWFEMSEKRQAWVIEYREWVKDHPR